MRRSLLRIPAALRCCHEAASGSLSACGSRAASCHPSGSPARLAAGAGLQSPSASSQALLSSRSWASTAAAAADDDTPAAALAPCERGPQAQAANELDSRLAAAAHAGGPTAVLQLVEEQGEQFSELNVITALEALQSGGSTSGEELLSSRPFQTLVGEQLRGWWLGGIEGCVLWASRGVAQGKCLIALLRLASLQTCCWLAYSASSQRCWRRQFSTAAAWAPGAAGASASWVAPPCACCCSGQCLCGCPPLLHCVIPTCRPTSTPLHTNQCHRPHTCTPQRGDAAGRGGAPPDATHR